MNRQEAYIRLLSEALSDILARMDSRDLALFGINRARADEIHRMMKDNAARAAMVDAVIAEWKGDDPALPLVEFLPGDGTTIMLPVSYIADFARGPDKRTCAFCLGDPCAEVSPPDAPISRFYQDAPRAETCPFCLGRPS